MSVGSLNWTVFCAESNEFSVEKAAWAESVSGGFCQDCVSCMGCSIAVNSLRLEMAWAPQISPEPLLSILLSGIFPRVETRPPIKT